MKPIINKALKLLTFSRFNKEILYEYCAFVLGKACPRNVEQESIQGGP